MNNGDWLKNNDFGWCGNDAVWERTLGPGVLARMCSAGPCHWRCCVVQIKHGVEHIFAVSEFATKPEDAWNETYAKYREIPKGELIPSGLATDVIAALISAPRTPLRQAILSLSAYIAAEQV